MSTLYEVAEPSVSFPGKLVSFGIQLLGSLGQRPAGLPSVLVQSLSWLVASKTLVGRGGGGRVSGFEQDLLI
jgi:hypothetical protein